MKFNKDLLQKKWIQNTLVVCIGVLFYVLLEHFGLFFEFVGKILRFLTPVIIGAAIAYVVDPLTQLFEHQLFGKMKKWQLRRMLAVTLALVLIVFLIVLLMVYLVPQIGNSISQFAENLSGYSQSLKEFIHKIGQKFTALSINEAKIGNFLDNIVNNFLSWIGENREVILDKGMNLGSGLVNVLLGFILAIYFLFGKYYIISGGKRFFRAALPASKYRGLMSFLDRCNKIMTRYIACDVVDGIIVGVVNGIFMMAMGMPYGILISVVVGVTNLAPTFGPLVGAVIGGLILLLVNPWYALIFIIFTLILQTVDGYILKPKLFGDSLGVSSVMILVFIIVGGRMFGILGVILSIPFAAIMHFVYHDYILSRMERKRGIADGASETPEAESSKFINSENEKEQLREARKQERDSQKDDRKEDWKEEWKERLERRKEEREKKALLGKKYESGDERKITDGEAPEDADTEDLDAEDPNAEDADEKKTPEDKNEE